jgi:hypothetical protein
MRTLGPGSVSSILKVVVEIVHAALWTLLALQVLGGCFYLLAEPFGVNILHLVPQVVHITGIPHFSGESPAVLGVLAFSILYVGVLLIVFSRLRRVLDALTRGDPFNPANVGRLRTIGLALVGLEAVGYLTRLTTRWFVRTEEPWRFSLNATGWFAILVVFVLAEVFREGARLRQEAELTI